MSTIASHSRSQSLFIVVATAALLAACADNAPVAPTRQPAPSPQLATLPVTVMNTQSDPAFATLRRVTDRYHDLNVALNEGFVLLHPCETRLGDEQVGTVYYNPTRLLDGVISPERPDALIYEPGRNGAKPTLVAVEFAVPFALWTQPNPPTFRGATFQREDEFGVFGLHIWIWRENPNGLFAESNPRVSCGT
jgi:hypothetical protein